MTDALGLVIDAALERALLADNPRRHFALAGALERGRSAGRPDGVADSRHDHGDPEQRCPEPSGHPTDVLGAALLSTVAVGALETTGIDDIDPGAWSPDSQDGGPHAELVAAGAAAACRRFDIDPATAATRSGLSAERLARYRVGGGAAPGPD